MPAVNFRVRWPDGQETPGYSPSTVIHQHLKNDAHYSLEEFMQRVETALDAASERVRELKGFYCSSAMDTLASLKHHARRYAADECVQVLDLQTTHSSRALGSWGEI